MISKHLHLILNYILVTWSSNSQCSEYASHLNLVDTQPKLNFRKVSILRPQCYMYELLF